MCFAFTLAEYFQFLPHILQEVEKSSQLLKNIGSMLLLERSQWLTKLRDTQNNYLSCSIKISIRGIRTPEESLILGMKPYRIQSVNDTRVIKTLLDLVDRLKVPLVNVIYVVYWRTSYWGKPERAPHLSVSWKVCIICMFVCVRNP